MASEERLKRVEILLETAAKAINRNTEAIAEHQENINRLNLQMLQLVDLVAELSAFTRQNQEEIRRIWEYLQGQQGNGRVDRSE
jgi:uncharacterized coiled-coil protein SlyX